MKFLIFLVACAAAQAVFVHGATRAHKALMTPLSLDAAQVRASATLIAILCL